MTRAENRDLESRYSSSEKGFDEFCRTVIEDRIINKHELLRLTRLKELYVNKVRQVENAEEKTEIQSAILKRKLMRWYPSLQFIRPTKRNASEIVCVEENKGVLVDNLGSTSASCEEDSERDSDKEVEPKNDDLEVENLLYMSGQVLKNEIADVPGLNKFWPPTASDLKTNSAETLIPTKLFNFLAWVTGVSDEIELANYVSTSDDNKRKFYQLHKILCTCLQRGREQCQNMLPLA